MNTWFSVLFHNNPNFSHLAFYNFLAKVMLFQRMHLISHIIRRSGLAPMEQFVLLKNKPHSEITKFLFHFH